MWITPKPFGVPALLGFWACGKAWDAPGIFWGKRHFGAPARGFWRRGGRAGRQPPGGNAEPRPQKGDFGRPKSGYPHYPQKRFPPKVEKKSQQLPGFWRRAHKLSTRLSTDRSAPPGASAQPQNRPKRGEKVYPATLYHTLPAHANKRMGGGREARCIRVKHRLHKGQRAQSRERWRFAKQIQPDLDCGKKEVQWEGAVRQALPNGLGYFYRGTPAGFTT